MKKNLLVTVGNAMMGDDAAGPMLARMIEQTPLENWDVLDGGNVPENYLFRIRELAPERVSIVDAADMGLPAGEIRVIGKDAIGGLFLMTTHTLPLTYLLEAIREFAPSAELIGIQPEVVAFGYPVSPLVKRAVEHLYDWLRRGGGGTGAPLENLAAIEQTESGQVGGADEVDCPAQDIPRRRLGSLRQIERSARS